MLEQGYREIERRGDLAEPPGPLDAPLRLLVLASLRFGDFRAPRRSALRCQVGRQVDGPPPLGLAEQLASRREVAELERRFDRLDQGLRHPQAPDHVRMREDVARGRQRAFGISFASEGDRLREAVGRAFLDVLRHAHAWREVEERSNLVELAARDVDAGRRMQEQ